MGRSGDGNHDNGSQSGSSCQFERLRLEPVYDTFMCPLTKKIMVKHLTARRLRIGSRSAESAEVRCKTLETLRIAVEEDSYLKTMMVERDTVRTIVKLLSHEQSKEWDEAISLMYELSKSEASSKKISADGREWKTWTSFDATPRRITGDQVVHGQFLGELTINNDVKVFVAKTAGPSLIG
ncbi:hypothetical protein MLD38_001850 [Melastoma candidum]|uniref:Uncharacterized protein n=1 Tax=Melastoma candidum TaxID=119954 RepID=A0ACB9SHU5_9MYRT|nr:hypothetical protein MLD38_001850 [Melastoma candidum]